MDVRLEQIVQFLNREHIRATYGAVGEALGLPAITIGGMLGDRCPEVSWVVSTESGLPSGYSAHELHPHLTDNPEIIYTGLALLQRIPGISTGSKRE